MQPFLKEDCLLEIFSFLPLSLLLALAKDKFRLSRTLQASLQFRWQMIASFPIQFQEVFGIPALFDIPVLPWKEAFEGWTGYIDQIRPEDVSEPLMMGTDPYSRRFLCIRSRCTVTQQMNVVTLFQRYSDNPHTWTFGTKCRSPTWVPRSGYFLVNGRMDPVFREVIIPLVQDQKTIRNVSYPSPHTLEFILV